MNPIQATIKTMLWAALRALYRVQAFNEVNIPARGAAILVPNHVSLLDAVVIAAHIDRPVHFAMYWRIYDALKWIVAPLGAFPIAGRDENPEAYARAFARIDELLAAGELLCIFPEGKLTRDGSLDAFRPGILKILERRPVPVIPVGLRGLWGSWFSYKKRGLLKLPEHWMAKVDMVIGDPLPPTASLGEIEAQVRSLAHGDWIG